MNGLPIISQIKSAVQAIAGDLEGARKTQEQFIVLCPVVSQLTSAVYAGLGDNKKAKETQIAFCENLLNILDAIPVVGHIKAVVHYARNEKEAAQRSLKTATRGLVVASSVVFVSVVLPSSLLFTLPFAAMTIATAIAFGIFYDAFITFIDTKVKGEFCPFGTIASVVSILQKIKKGENVAGDLFDLSFMIAMDGLTGYFVGKFIAQLRKPTTTIYRVASKSETERAINEQQLQRGYQQGKKHGETWVTESKDHSIRFQKTRNTQHPNDPYVIEEITIDKHGWEHIKADSVPQQGSSTTNHTNNPSNVYNHEGTTHGQMNVGIKGDANLNHINSQIVAIEQSSPSKLNLTTRNTLTATIGSVACLFFPHLLEPFMSDSKSKQDCKTYELESLCSSSSQN